jgi:hypothetical protein
VRQRQGVGRGRSVEEIHGCLSDEEINTKGKTSGREVVGRGRRDKVGPAKDTRRAYEPGDASRAIPRVMQSVFLIKAALGEG